VFTGTPGAYLPGDGVRVRRHEMLDLSVSHRNDDATVDELRNWFRSELTTPDPPIRLVHGHNLHHFSSVPARALKSLQEELNLVLPHTYHSIWRTAEHERIARACAIWDVHHAVSDFLVRECAEVLGRPVNRTYLGVDTSTYLSVPGLQETGSRPVVLLPARLIPDKGATVAVRMLRHLMERGSTGAGSRFPPRPRLVLTDPVATVDFHGERVGFRYGVSRLVDKLGLTEGPGQNVEFRSAGFDDMRKLYEEATVVVYPSRFNEPMGLAPLEAMCAARPVVVTGVGGLGEGGSTLVEPEEDEDMLAVRLADEVSHLLAEPSRARDAGLAAREHVLARFDLERVYVEPMLAEYERLLGQLPYH